MYTHAFHKADIIVTVSETSKKEILEQYRVHAGQIYVAGNGWQHMDRKDTDETIFQKYPKLTKGAYYYYLASLAPNKNLSWILKNAAGNPDKIYVLSGKPLGDDSGVEKLDNVICTGYVSDSEARALMQYCRAFLFPSTYEALAYHRWKRCAWGRRWCLAIFQCCMRFTEMRHITWTVTMRTSALNNC